MEVLRWALEHNCPWSAGICLVAAESGDVEVLRLAREHTCTVDIAACKKMASRNNHAGVSEWLGQFSGLTW